jgi:hypothetical protein
LTCAVINVSEPAAGRRDALDHVRIERFAGSGHPFHVGEPGTGDTVPDNTRKDRGKLMATPFTHLLVAVAILTMAYGVVSMSANGRPNDVRAAAHVPAELVQWHSGFTVTTASGVKPEWKSTRSAMDAEDSRAFLVMHGAIGIRGLAEDRFDYQIDSLNAPKGARKPAAIREGSAQRRR